jgi:alpha-tubulin suppressor-like RCC1 family protein
VVKSAFVIAVAVLVAGCTDWSSLSTEYDGDGVCPTYVVAGDTHTCARKSNGSLTCWGDNRFGQLGTGDTKPHSRPTRVGVGDVSKIFVGTGNGDITADIAGFTCAITTSNGLRCWGDNRFTQFGTSPDRELSPIGVNVPVNLSTAALGGGHLCTLDAAGSVICLGNDSSGQVGTDGPQNKKDPFTIPGLVADKLVAGATHTCVRRSDATMLCWGGNVYGQLGTGTTTPTSHPTEVKELLGRVARFATGANHTCAQTPDGELWCWGDNRYGQLGLGDRGNRLSPTKLPGSNDASAKVFAGGGHSCAIHADGSFWCWGDNRSGQLGLGDKESRLAPTRVEALGNDVVAAYTGGAHTCVLRADSSVWCFGNNQYGQLGAEVGTDGTRPVAALPACH